MAGNLTIPVKYKLAKKYLRGEIKLSELSAMAGSEENAMAIRKEALRIKYGAELNDTKPDFTDIAKRNTENLLGLVSVPYGYVEVSIKEGLMRGTHPVFLATTEGRLIAGINRGAKAIDESGGATVEIFGNKMTRSVIIETKGIKDTKKIMDFVKSNEGLDLAKKEFSKYTKHSELKSIECHQAGKYLFLVYEADTKAAMGMNILTIASSNATAALIRKLNDLGITCELVSESGNMCVDKKPSYLNIQKGRGVSIVAEVTIPKEIITKHFGIAPAHIVKLNTVKNYIGSDLAGSLGHNAQVANILAATYIAYGQDPAQVAEGSTASDYAELTENGDLNLIVKIPALEVGTYGGGTVREMQKQLLIASGVYGEGDEIGVSKLKLAELIATTALAAELNLIATLAKHELGKAHASLKRG